MSERIANLSEGELDSALHGNAMPLLLDLWAPWCGPCLALAPILESLAEQTQGVLQIAKVDVEQYPDAMSRFGIRGIPVLLLFRNGKEIARSVGLKSLVELSAWLQSHDIAVQPSAQTMLQPQVKWGSFYGDKDLRDFMLQRLQQLAVQGKLQEARSHFWWQDEGNGTSSAALVRSSDLAVFEQQTALPATIALVLSQTAFFTPEDISKLTQMLDVNRDTSAVPLFLIASWLREDEQLCWSAWLQDSEANQLRQKWLNLATPYLNGQTVALKDWQNLRTQASQNESRQPLEQALVKLVENLSPPPSIQDTENWMAIMQFVETCLTEIMMLSAGFTMAECMAFAQRSQDFLSKAGNVSIFSLSEEFIETNRKAWEGEHADLAIKERDFNAHYKERTADILRAWQTRIEQAFNASPVFGASKATS